MESRLRRQRICPKKNMLGELDGAMVLLIYRHALSCVRRDRAVCRCFRQMLPTCHRIALPDAEEMALPAGCEQDLRRDTECDRVLKLSIDGPTPLPFLRRVLENRFDRIVALRVGAAQGACCINRWSGDMAVEKEILLKEVVRACCSLEELILTGIGLEEEHEVETLAEALRGAPPSKPQNVLIHRALTDITVQHSHVAAGRINSDDHAEKIGSELLHLEADLARVESQDIVRGQHGSQDRSSEDDSRRGEFVHLMHLRLERNNLTGLSLMRSLAKPI